MSERVDLRDEEMASGSGGEPSAEPGDGAGASRDDEGLEDSPAATATGPSIATATVQSGITQADLLIAAGEFNYSNITNFGDLGGQSLERLSRDDFDELGREELTGIAIDDGADARFVGRALKILEEKRVLCLAGKARTGKGTLAISLTRRLVEDGQLDGALLCRRLDTRLRFRPDHVRDSLRIQGRRMVIFEDALAQDNRDLKRFLKDLDAVKLRAVSRRLEEEETLLLLTLEEGTVSELKEKLESSGVLLDAPRPTQGHIVAVIRREAGALRSETLSGTELDARLETLLERSSDVITAHFAGVPEVSRFCKHHLLAVLEGRLDLLSALERSSDLTRWFLDEAERDREGWCSLLALTLASSSPWSEAVPWLAQRDLADSLSNNLRRSLARDQSEREPKALFSSHLEVSQVAVFERERDPVGVVVRFVDRGLGERLWSVLLGPGRSISWWLVPQLEELAEFEDPSLRRIAARALGRIGELAPASVVYPRMDAWSDQKRLDVLTDLFVGALASRRSEYRDGIVGWLRGGLRAAKPERVRAACVCLPLLAGLDVDLALDELRAVFVKRFGKTEGDLRNLSAALRRPGGGGAGGTRRVAGQARSGAGLELGEADREFLEGARYALTGFCLGDERIEVIRRVREWSVTPDEPLSLLILTLFFRRGGVFDVLHRFPVTVGEAGRSGRTSRPCDRLLASAMVEDAADDVARFFEAAYGRFGELSNPHRGELRRRLLGRLSGWAKRPLDASVAGILIRILSLLLESTDAELAERVFDLLRTDPMFAEEDSPGAELARAALSFGPSDGEALARR